MNCIARNCARRAPCRRSRSCCWGKNSLLTPVPSRWPGSETSFPKRTKRSGGASWSNGSSCNASWRDALASGGELDGARGRCARGVGRPLSSGRLLFQQLLRHPALNEGRGFRGGTARRGWTRFHGAVGRGLQGGPAIVVRNQHRHVSAVDPTHEQPLQGRTVPALE